MRHLRALRRLRTLLSAAAVLLALFAAGCIIFSLCSAPVQLSFTPTPEARRHPAEAARIPNYARDEVDTFYTFPEWYIVWSYQTKADYQRTHLPSGYSFFGDIGQFWQAYSRIYAATRRAYPFAAGDHVMLVVIGSSFTIEYALKGLYEETVGRISEWTSGHQAVAEDDYAAEVAENYATFVHLRPFYEFSFLHALEGLWSGTPFRSTHLVRSLERRAWYSLDYAVESVYCELIELATHATYGFEDVNTTAWVGFAPHGRAHVLDSVKPVKLAKAVSADAAILQIPRYQPFTAHARSLIADGARFYQIAGNELIVTSQVAPSAWTNSDARLQTLLAQPILTQPGKMRVVLLGRVEDLHQTIPLLEKQGLALEHIYDY